MGLHATYGGQIYSSYGTISTTGSSSPSLSTLKGKGVINCDYCTLSTSGSGSPLIYSNGEIKVTNTTGKATNAQMVVIEGKNTAVTVEKFSILECYGNGKSVDNCGIFLYQSTSGNDKEGINTFNCLNSAMKILKQSKVYDSAPMFFVTNTKANINLEKCDFNYGSNIFLNIKGTSEWGKSGSNGGQVTLNLKNQEIKGDLIVDKISTLNLVMINSTFTGAINNGKTASKLNINLDKNSKIILTKNSYYTSLTNEDKSGKNIDKKNFKFSSYDVGKWIKTSSLVLIIFLFL